MSNMFALETKIKLKLVLRKYFKAQNHIIFNFIQDKPLYKCSDNFVPELLELFSIILFLEVKWIFFQIRNLEPNCQISDVFRLKPDSAGL